MSPPPPALDSVGTILARAALVLRDRGDPEGRELASEVQRIKYRVHFACEHARDLSRAAVLQIVDETTALNERIVDYAAKYRIRYLAIDTQRSMTAARALEPEPEGGASTQRMRVSQFPDELRAAINGMSPGANVPPPEVAAVLEESVAALADRHPTILPPASPATSEIPPSCLDDDRE